MGLSNGLHDGVFDAVMNHLDEMPGPTIAKPGNGQGAVT